MERNIEAVLIQFYPGSLYDDKDDTYLDY